MPEAQNGATSTPTPKNASAGDPAQYGKRTPEGANGRADQVNQAANAADAVTEKAADAGKEAIRASSEILRTNVEAAQDAMRTSLESGMRAFEDMAQNMSRVFGVATPDPQLAEHSVRNVRAVSQASTALARGGQEASRAWFELAQQTVRTNLEALSQVASCRTVQDLVAVQTDLARNNLQRAIEGGQTMARASTQAIEEASRAMQSASLGANPQA
jgi:hypothetical protein